MANSSRAKEIISKIIYITIATVSKDGDPWNSPVYSAYDEQYNFYWASWKDNVHSKNIHATGKAFLVIYDSTVPEGTGEGVYVQAKALKLLYERKNKSPRNVEEFLGDYPRRVYRAIPIKVWINDMDDLRGNNVDVRKEIKL